MAVGLDDSETGINYSLLIDGVVSGSPVAGTGNAISFGNQTTAGTYTAKAVSSGCENNMTGAATVIVKNVPAVPSVPAGPNSVVAVPGMATQFTTSPVADAVTYEWSIEPAVAGSMQGNTVTANAVWGNTWFNDNALITVKATNECGISSFSQAHTVAVENFVGVDAPEAGALKVYPNPASDFVSIENGGSNLAVVKLYNLAGQLVKEVSLAIGQKSQLDLSKLGSGIYQMVISEGNITRSTRLVVE